MNRPTLEPAPGTLEAVRGFLNTRDIEDSTDLFDTPDGVGSWMTGAGLLPAGTTPSESDRERAVELREAIRGLLRSDPGALPALDRIAADVGALVPTFTQTSPGGPDVTFEPVALGVRGGMAKIIAIIAADKLTGEWPRLKVCDNDACQWAFYDHARNHSGRWCSMAVCGNRMKARSYRTRSTRR